MRDTRPYLRGRAMVGLVAVAVAMVVAPAAVIPAPAATTCTAADKPVVFPEDQLHEGMVATGHTVIHGTTQETFDGKIIGILPDAVVPGIDVILVELSGAVIDQTGGAAYGMSGSPFYIDDQFVGALIYGPPGGYGNQRIAGLMPAQHIVDLFDYPQAGAAAARWSKTVHLSTAQRRSAANAADTSASNVPNQLEQLRVPVGVSGLNDRAMRKFQSMIDQLHLPFLAYRAGGSAAPTAASGSFTAGDAAAAVASYGDVSAYGIGTVAATCDADAILFGHPFFLDGSTQLGLSGATILTVVQDPSGLIGPYKVGNVTDTRGLIDQDRFAGLRGTEGIVPVTYPITSSVTNEDLDKTRQGETDVVKQSLGGFSFFANLAPFAVLAEQDSTFDQISGGTNTQSWTLTGQTGEGASWTLTRENMAWSPFDASFEGINELLNDVFILAINDLTDVTFTGLDWTSSMTTARRTVKITEVSVATPGSDFSTKRRVVVHPGDRLRIQVVLQPFGEDTTKTVRVSVLLPRDARGSSQLAVRGGTFGIGEDGRQLGSAKTFEDLVASLQNAEHNSDLVVETAFATKGKAVETHIHRNQGTVVLGGKFFNLELAGIPIVCTGGGKGGHHVKADKPHC
jgi:hypothetical protein